MENLKNKICKSIPYFCSAGMQAPKLVVKTELKETESANAFNPTSKQKPWSVFGEVYWI